MPDALALAESGNDLLGQLSDIKITTVKEFERVAQMGILAKQMVKNIQAGFEDPKRKADEAHKGICKLEKKALKAAQECEELSKEKLLETHRIIEEWKADGVSFSDWWVVEVTDESILPREYMMPDFKKITGIGQSLGTECRIPGVKVYPKTRIAYRA